MAKLNKVREELSQRFVEALSMGELPWHSCWQQTLPQNAVTGRKYHGLNALWLSYLAEKKGWTDPRWATYKQASEKGWQVRKGEKASYVEYWAYYDKEKKKLLSWPDARQIFREDPAYAEKNLQLSSRVFAVFNGAQIDGIPEIPQSRGTDIGAIRRQRDTLIANMGIGYREQGQSAYYSLGSDTVTLPLEASFDSTYGYMATFLHECGHASGHPDRLNRDLTGGFGSESYAKEELRAEIASAFTAQALGLTVSEQDRELETKQHMAYIQNWAQAIKDAPEELFKALKDAEKISDYLIEQGEFQPIIDRAAEEVRWVGRIEYLGCDGEVGDFAEFDSVDDFIRQIKDDSDCGRPAQVVLYRDKEGKTIPYQELLKDVPLRRVQIVNDPHADMQSEYYLFYDHERYLFTADTEERASEVEGMLACHAAAAGYNWQDDGMVILHNEPWAPANISGGPEADRTLKRVEATPENVEAYLREQDRENNRSAERHAPVQAQISWEPEP